MEKPLDKQLDDIMNAPGVVGVMCADKQGLCLGAKGNGLKCSSGLISHLAQQVSALQPDSREIPTVCIESDAGTVLIKMNEDITMAIYKVPS